MFHADLHIHSRFSRACSKDCDIEHLAWWALRKGISVVGTGDFTHPAWAAELRETLIPAEPGLFRLRPGLERQLRRTSPRSCAGEVRFLLSAEISTIYRGGDRTRKVHHLIYAPTFESADRITEALARIGNLASDGRPILGLPSRDLLEITLAGGPGCYLIPAHAWTPWFAVLGSKSGFDLVADCYGDLAGEIFAIETGLSSDPAMNWMCSSLDGYQLVSNSDAHSPPMLGREATTLSCELDYFAMARAFRTGEGLSGTLEFFPAEGKYHLDGHRKCGVRLEPDASRARDGICPECGKPLTIGVAHRVAELADRPAGYRPPGAPGYTSLVQLRQIVGEIVATGPASKKVAAEVSRLVGVLGPELGILCDVPLADAERAGGSVLAEALARLRRGAVTREAGYDGEYGTVRLFQPGELDGTAALFDLPSSVPSPRSGERPAAAGPAALGPAAPGRGGSLPPVDLNSAETDRSESGPRQPSAGAAGRGPSQPGADELAAVQPSPDRAGPGTPGADGPSASLLNHGESALAALDPEQRAAVLAAGPLMIVAGPGTGKTRTLTHRIAAQVAAGVPADRVLAVTFTRRAAEEMRARLAVLGGPQAQGRPGAAGALAGVAVTTFHGLGLRLLRELHREAGLPADFHVADEATVAEVIAELAVPGGTVPLDAVEPATGGALAAGGVPAAGGAPATGTLPTAGAGLPAGTGQAGAERGRLLAALTARGLADFDGLIELPAAVLRRDPALAAAFRERWPVISVDEYQDIDPAQYDLLGLLAGDGAGLTVIGDPDQAIYGFRRADVGFFLRFGTDYPGAVTHQLSRNYRSSAPIVTAAVAAIAPATLVPGRGLRAVSGAPAEPVIAHEAADEHAEAGWISATIDQLLGGTSFHSIDSGRAAGDGHAGLSLADIAVLYRTDAQSAALGQALTRAGLPFRKGSHDLLHRRPGVPEILAELKLSGTGPAKPGPGPAAPEPDGTRPVAGLVAAAAARLSGRPSRYRAVDILAAAEVLAPLARRCGTDLGRFATEVALGAEVDALDPRADAVTLLTMHAAKGLEYEVVFVAGCEDGLLPLRVPGGGMLPGTDPAEERRLLFVAMTRARSRLLISYAARRTRRGETAPAGASPFMQAVGQLLATGRVPRPRPPARQLRLL
ncbi:MAG TPA: UvrD-helicase domain-containing protein [Streptosporangiaceae bacterium]|nr:UvrD-helicase domain-containing protein [Streptosporangiaceae bacterium]